MRYKVVPFMRYKVHAYMRYKFFNPFLTAKGRSLNKTK